MGISNLKLIPTLKQHKGCNNLLDLALLEIQNKWNKLINDNKIHFSFIDNFNHKIKVNIKLSDDSNIKKSGNSTWTMNLREDEDINIMLASFVHEITHISQKYNKFKDYSFKITWNLFKKLKNKKLKYYNYYDEVAHSEMGTEHEAKLVSLLWYIKNNYIEHAFKHIYYDKEYFRFSSQTFYKKIYSFGIRDTKCVNLLKDKLNVYINEFFLDYKISYEQGNLNSLGDLYVFINGYIYISKMLNLDISNYFIWIKTEINLNLNILSSSNSFYNWNVILDNLSKY